MDCGHSALTHSHHPITHQIWAAVTHCGGAHAPGGETAGVGEEPGISLEETNAMERAFLTRLDHQLFIAPATYASTYFELCSLVPSHASEEALRRQLHRMTELAGACVPACVPACLGWSWCGWMDGNGLCL